MSRATIGRVVPWVIACAATIGVSLIVTLLLGLVTDADPGIISAVASILVALISGRWAWKSTRLPVDSRSAFATPWPKDGARAGLVTLGMLTTSGQPTQECQDFGLTRIALRPGERATMEVVSHMPSALAFLVRARSDGASVTCEAIRADGSVLLRSGASNIAVHVDIDGPTELIVTRSGTPGSGSRVDVSTWWVIGSAG